MAKLVDFKWQKMIPKCLVKGGVFERWDDCVGMYEADCFVRVDEYGFFLYWKCPNKEGQLLDVSHISDVRQGRAPTDPKINDLLMTFSLSEGLGNIEERTFTICSNTDLVNVTFTQFSAKDKRACREWMDALRLIIHNRNVSNICPLDRLKKHWKKITHQLNAVEKIPVRSITRTFTSGRTEKIVLNCLRDLGLPHGKNQDIEVNLFTFDKFYELYHKICPRTEIQSLFNDLSSGTNYINIDGLVKFLNEKQRDPRLNEILFPFHNREYSLQLIKMYEPNPENRRKERLGLDGFCKYLMSDDNAPVFLDRLEIYQDMTKPLSHYLINSSHNTYLVGRQFGGRSSVEMYRQVLLAGCRCIELDCWDGKGEDQEPIITHGKAMCTDILFKDVIYAINETAFVTSEYPVILSFENHCCKKQQFKLAKYCKDSFGDKLLSKPLEQYPLEPNVPLPSPEDLKYKILIKNKRIKNAINFNSKRSKELEEQGEGEEGEVVDHYDDDEDDDDNENENTTSLNNNNISSSSQLTKTSTTTFSNSTITNNNNNNNNTNNNNGNNNSNFTSNSVLSVTTRKLSSSFMRTSTDVKHVNDMITTIEESGRLNHRIISTNDNGNDLTNNVNGNNMLDCLDDSLTNERTTKNHHGSNMLKKMGEGLKLISNTKKDSTLTKEQEEELMSKYKYTGATTNIHQDLSDLVNYTQPVKFQTFLDSEERSLHFQMSSFNENVALSLLKQFPVDFVNYNKRQLSRIYPKGGRVDSSNFMPQIFWNAGCQMVSLNFQTPDLGIQINQGKFEYNNNCGYLLKPNFMIREDRQFDPFSESAVDGVIAAYCSIKIISGQFLSDKKIGTYVEVDMYGLPTDTIRREFKTKTVPNNGLNPQYNEEPFEFRKIVLPDLAVIRIAVYEETNKLIGQRVLPLDGLQAGYRHVSLRTEANFPMSLPTVFIHIVLSTYIPVGLSEIANALNNPLAVEKKITTTSQPSTMDLLEDNLSDNIQQSQHSHSHHQPQSILGRNSEKLTKKLSGQQTQLDGQHQSHVLNNYHRRSITTSMIPESNALDENKQKFKEAESAEQKQMSVELESITFDSLKQDKLYIKLLKRQSIEYEQFQRRLIKEKHDMMKNQTAATESMLEKERRNRRKQNKPLFPANSEYLYFLSPKSSQTTNMNDGKNEYANLQFHSESFKNLIYSQSVDWKEIMQRHTNDRYGILLLHLNQQSQLLREMLNDRHDKRMKMLQRRQDKDVQNIKMSEARDTMEDRKKINIDKSIKSKQEKERRIKELLSNNAKRFIEQRRRLALRHTKEKDTLEELKLKDLEKLEEEITRQTSQLELKKEEAISQANIDSILC
ncbi:hypothetical protein SNEBB_001958 [Seison nebaliae]|nr:hypothetical protein SNEBB_001958 [Seison nebaliae]